MADTFQTFYLLLLFFCGDVFGLKVNQLDQSTTYIHAKPWESCETNNKQNITQLRMVDKTEEKKKKKNHFQCLTYAPYRFKDNTIKQKYFDSDIQFDENYFPV